MRKFQFLFELSTVSLLSPESIGRLEHVKAELDRLCNPHEKKSVRTNRRQVLMRHVQARLRTAQRLTTLTMDEERGRWESTLQSYYRTLFEAMHVEHLQGKVSDPEGFVKNVGDCEIVHCDQIPMWLRPGSAKALYRAAEGRLRKNHQLKQQGLCDPGGQVMDLHGLDGMTQLRQHGAPEGNRFRVTLETSQIVSNVFKPHEMPTVRHGRLVLIVPGRHARLSNIDKGGFFIEDETFVVKNKTVLRRKGESAGALMKSWRDLRDGDDEEARRWLSRVEVMQQPAAFADGVITSWICEMRLKHEGLITQVCVRDLFAGGLSASIQCMSYMTHQLRTYVAGKSDCGHAAH